MPHSWVRGIHLVDCFPRLVVVQILDRCMMSRGTKVSPRYVEMQLRLHYSGSSDYHTKNQRGNYCLREFHPPWQQRGIRIRVDVHEKNDRQMQHHANQVLWMSRRKG